MFKDKELRKLLNNIKVINCNEDEAHYELERIQKSGITEAHVKSIELQKKRIDELEAKVNALMELLAVKEVQPETERKLKKGNKEVVIGKKYIVWEGRK